MYCHSNTCFPSLKILSTAHVYIHLLHLGMPKLPVSSKLIKPSDWPNFVYELQALALNKDLCWLAGGECGSNLVLQYIYKKVETHQLCNCSRNLYLNGK